MKRKTIHVVWTWELAHDEARECLEVGDIEKAKFRRLGRSKFNEQIQSRHETFYIWVYIWRHDVKTLAEIEVKHWEKGSKRQQ
jgi:hypothetical protein